MWHPNAVAMMTLTSGSGPSPWTPHLMVTWDRLAYPSPSTIKWHPNNSPPSARVTLPSAAVTSMLEVTSATCARKRSHGLYTSAAHLSMQQLHSCNLKAKGAMGSP
eukprot:1160945-Pelagomonas_calceolata.AAC.1